MITKSALCSGCLSYGRELQSIDDEIAKQTFQLLIKETSLYHQDENENPIILCWECKALLIRFSKFKQQVVYSISVLQSHIDKIDDRKKLCQSKLYHYRVFNLSLEIDSSLSATECWFEVITAENRPLQVEPAEVKLEREDDCGEDGGDVGLDASLSNDDSEDEKLLVEFRKKSRRETRRKERSSLYRAVELNRDEIEEERRVALSGEEYVNAMFKCDKCVITFPNEDDLIEHRSGKHDPKRAHHCDICECTFQSEVSFSYHSGRHRKRFQCERCSERFLNKRSVLNHYEWVHCYSANYNNRADSVQNGHADGKADNTKHQSSVITGEEFACDMCEKRFRWKTSLRKHSETHRIESGEKRRPYCEACDLPFRTSSNLKKHVKTSSKHQMQLKLRMLKGTQAEQSEDSKAREENINRIRCSINESRQVYPCAQCDRRFQWRGNLLRHLHSHKAKANGELVCEPCNRSFSSIATYQQHMKISKKHASEDDFKYICSDCGKRFANKTRLKEHVDWEHLKVFAHKCPTCGKVFKSHTSLYVHRQVHQKGGFKYLCDHCGRDFQSRGKLRGHITGAHSAESPYACSMCPARFSWHSCLSRHVRRAHSTTTRADKQ